MVKSQPLAVIFKRDYVFFLNFLKLLFTSLFNLLEALISHVTELNDFVISYLYWRIISFVSDPTFSFLEKKYQSRMSCVIWNDEFDNNSTNVLICLPLSFFSFSYLIVQRNHQANIENSCWKDSKRNQHMILSFTILLIIEGRASYFDGRRCVGLDTATKGPLSKGF